MAWKKMESTRCLAVGLSAGLGLGFALLAMGKQRVVAAVATPAPEPQWQAHAEFLGDAFNWVASHAPWFECSDEDITTTYYYRWRLVWLHIRRTRFGPVLTEFLGHVNWAGPAGTINCPFGHQAAEARWVRDAGRMLENYTLFWWRHPKADRRYTWWPAHATLEGFRLHGRLDVLERLRPHLEAEYARWVERSTVPTKGAPECAWQAAHDDGEENSIGLDGCRPTINAALYGEAAALATISRLLGASAALVDHFEADARRWQAALESLWRPDLRFFVTRALPPPASRAREIAARRTKLGCLYCYGRRRGPKACPPDWPAGELVDVRELQGLTSPWYHRAARAEHAVAFEQIRLERGFAAPWGVTTAERRHRCYNFSTWCPTSWHGPVWPFESAKLGTALINALHDVSQRARYGAHVRPADFIAFLGTYARMHTQGRARDVPAGTPFVGESFHGDEGYWLTRELLYERRQGDRNRGEHYFHSSYVDLVLSGLVGVHVLLPTDLAAHAEAERSTSPGFGAGGAALLVVEPLVEIGTPAAVKYFATSGMLVRGRQVAVAYDGTGGERPRYGIRGLAVWLDGVLVAQAPGLRRLVVRL